MSERTRASTNQPTRGIVRIFNILNIALPEEFRLPGMIDVRSLNAAKAKFNNLDVQLTKLKCMVRISQGPEVTSVVDERALAAIATSAWRARTRMVDPDTGQAKEEMKRVYRHIEAIFDALKEIGVETIDPMGRPYDSGMALKVISFEQTPGLAEEKIKETIKPSVVWQGRFIQMGEVIVGTPQTV